ncbi:hypothetical protein OLMES_4310 [Oleiphilus messinensis]|uniref:Uncharacterized protein n=1 Tax=Oleiphilus messinensis TaxID=141451 RepID=A0A1Y0IDS9_9GAMM|nr:hypothetical protein [Oleiphilus messinensis]ARU58319.1 hypothetical protein OLMES_4310 [Oleiphilus messinensis]
MSDKTVKHLSDRQREKNGSSIEDAIKRAKQHIRNIGADDLEEPEGFASGDMKKFLENPDEYGKEDDDARKDDK